MTSGALELFRVILDATAVNFEYLVKFACYM